MGRLAPIRLSAAEREMLEGIGSLTETHPRVAQRIRVVLLAAAGTSNRAIAAATGMHYNRVGVWRRRYSLHGLAGLEDEERSGRPSVYGVDATLTLMSIIATPPPDGLPRWTVKLLADQMAVAGIPISVSQLWRISVGLDLLESSASQWVLAKRQDQWVDRVEVCALGSTESLRSIVFAVSDDPTSLPLRLGISRLLAGSTLGDEAIVNSLSRVDPGQATVSLVYSGSVAGVSDLANYLRTINAALGDSHVLYCVVSGVASELGELDAIATESNGQVSIHRSSSSERWLNQARLILNAHHRYVTLRDSRGSHAMSATLVELLTDHRHDELELWWNRELVAQGGHDETSKVSDARDERSLLRRRGSVTAEAISHGAEHGRAQPLPTLAS